MNHFFIPSSVTNPFVHWAGRRSNNRQSAQRLLRGLLAFPQSPKNLEEISFAIEYFIHD